MLEVSWRISASEPSHQWIARGCVSSRTEFTQFATSGLNWGSEVIRCAAVAIHDSSYYSSVVSSCAIAKAPPPMCRAFIRAVYRTGRPVRATHALPRNYNEALQDPFINRTIRPLLFHY